QRTRFQEGALADGAAAGGGQGVADRHRGRFSTRGLFGAAAFRDEVRTAAAAAVAATGQLFACRSRYCTELSTTAATAVEAAAAAAALNARASCTESTGFSWGFVERRRTEVGSPAGSAFARFPGAAAFTRRVAAARPVGALFFGVAAGAAG